MKKLLLAAAATAAFSSSAFADNEFYLRGDAGYNKFNDVKVSGVSLKGKYSPSMEFGVGYNVMDNVRAELVYGYHFNKDRKWSKTPVAGVKDDVRNVSLKGKIQTLMVKGYADVADLGVAQIFAGAGVGFAQKDFTASVGTTTITAPTTTVAASTKTTDTAKKDKSNGFTYSLALGSSFDVADSVKMDVQYNFQDFGKVSKAYKVSYRAHAIKAGVRFAL